MECILVSNENMNFYLDQLDDANDKWWVVFFLSLFLFSQTMNSMLYLLLV